MKKLTAALTGAAAMVFVAGVAQATPIYSTFGQFPAANFGGNGIPNDAVAATTVFVNGSQKVTLALTAHERYSNPPVTNNGAGEFYAGTGQNCGIATDPVGCPSTSQGALWNFGFYIETQGADFADFTFTLYYDFDPAAGTLPADLGWINVNNAIQGPPYLLNPATTTLFQDSQNLLFSGFAANVPFVIDPPTLASFNPNATGEYNLYLQFSSANIPGWSGIVGIDVNVVPVPAAVWMLGSALGVLGWIRRRARTG